MQVKQLLKNQLERKAINTQHSPLLTFGTETKQGTSAERALRQGRELVSLMLSLGRQFMVVYAKDEQPSLHGNESEERLFQKFLETGTLLVRDVVRELEEEDRIEVQATVTDSGKELDNKSREANLSSSSSGSVRHHHHHHHHQFLLSHSFS